MDKEGLNPISKRNEKLPFIFPIVKKMVLKQPSTQLNNIKNGHFSPRSNDLFCPKSAEKQGVAAYEQIMHTFFIEKDLYSFEFTQKQKDNIIITRRLRF